MNKEEFEKRVGENVNIAITDYEKIDKVYTWHPAISETNGKDQIATLYKTGGMELINSMVEVSDIMIALDTEKREIERKLEKLKDREQRVRRGSIEYERCLKALRNAYEMSGEYDEFQKMVETIKLFFNEELVNKVMNSNDWRICR